MADVNIDVSGDIEMPPTANAGQRFFQFGQLPQAKEWIQERRQNIRPWMQFGQGSNFKLPQSLPRLGRRFAKNIEYFQSNYIFVFLVLIVYCLITSPLVLLAVGCSLYVGYHLSKRHAENKRFVAFGHELTLAHQYAIVALCSLPVFYLVGAGAAMFWVLGASIFVIGLHACFYNIDAVVEDDFTLLQNV